MNLYSGLQKYLNQQGFNIVGYGCTTCIGNSGDLDESVASAITENGIISSLSVLFVIYLSFFLRGGGGTGRGVDFGKQRCFLRNILRTGDITILCELVFIKPHFDLRASSYGDYTF